MPIRNTGRSTVGPFVVNYGKTGTPSSVSAKLGPLTFRLWSRTYEAGVSSIDLPGPFSQRPTPTRKQRRSR